MTAQAPTDPRIALALELTQIPTAAGREQRVLAWLDAWLAARPLLHRAEDKAGNIVISLAPAKGAKAAKATKAKSGKPLFITGHLDHPAFVVERIVAPGVIEMSFRGGVMDVFFEHAPVTLHTRLGPVPATIAGPAETQSPAGTHYLCELDDAADLMPCDVQIGDVATWRLPAAHVDEQGVLHTHACDDLAAVAAALCAIDALSRLRAAGKPIGDVRVLLTRAEEIGFIGAIAACKLKTMPAGSRVLALENSRAFPESPVGGGPIVRVGDRMSVFTPWLTDACAKRAEEIFASPAQPRASETNAVKKRPWQRKLMAGGACEASVFCRAGYDATCLCLPLGNYHNMPYLTELQAGTYDRATLGPARCAPEFIHTQDYLGLIDLLVALGENLPEPEHGTARFDKLYESKGYVLGTPAIAAKPARSANSPAKTSRATTKRNTTARPSTKRIASAVKPRKAKSRT